MYLVLISTNVFVPVSLLYSAGNKTYYYYCYCVCDDKFDSFCCRFTSVSRVIEHGCRIASPAWAVNTENLFYWNTTTGNNSSTDVSLWRLNVKIKCKEYLLYPMLACRGVNRPKHVVRWHELWLLIAQSLTTHASTQPAVGAAIHHSQNAYLTAMFDQYIGGYFNN